MATLVEISIDKDTERVLERLKGEYPTLDAPELFKLGLAELERKLEFGAQRRWAERLPTLDISGEEALSIAEGRREIERGEGRKVTAKELMAELLED